MKQTPKTENKAATTTITLTEEQRAAFIRTVKIGYFRDFYKRGLITAEQLEQLIAMQNIPAEKKMTDSST